MKNTLPGFTADASLYRTKREFVASPMAAERATRLIPQARFGGDPDIGEYIRCRQNGGGELVCRFFAGLPPWTIGGVLR
jgi:hypothetical protein